MKRTVYILSAALLLGLLLAGCRCKHDWASTSCTEDAICRLCGQRSSTASGHNWADATCAAPKTCTVCQATEGKPLEHHWIEATCAKAKTCTGCGATEGDPLPHTWDVVTCTEPKTCTTCGATQGGAFGHSWQEATCDQPKTCNICAQTEGEPLEHLWKKATCTTPQSCLLCGLWTTPALGHSWLDATCEKPIRCDYCDVTQGEPLGHSWVDATPEAPKTCSTCGKTEGLPIELDDRFISADCAPLFGSWTYLRTTTAEELNIPGFNQDLKEHVTYSFGIYGDLLIRIEVTDINTYKAMQKAMIIAEIYAGYATPEEAEAFWAEEYDQTVEEYAEDLLGRTPEDDGSYIETGVYYVSEGQLFLSNYWEDPFSGFNLTVSDNTLTLTDELTGDVLVLTKV